MRPTGLGLEISLPAYNWTVDCGGDPLAIAQTEEATITVGSSRVTQGGSARDAARSGAMGVQTSWREGWPDYKVVEPVFRTPESADRQIACFWGAATIKGKAAHALGCASASASDSDGTYVVFADLFAKQATWSPDNPTSISLSKAVEAISRNWRVLR